MKNTLLPLDIKGLSMDGNHVVIDHQDGVIELYGENKKAHAEFIVRACRAHDELLEALKLLHDNLAEYQRINNIGGYENHDMCMARAAIAKAKAK